jgi:Zn-dependent protease with chaperone function
VALAPRSVDTAIGQRALADIDGRWMKPSRLPLAYQKQLARRFQQALDRHRLQPAGAAPASRWDHSAQVQLVFRQSHIGPNALALPDGTVVLTDELVELVERREDVLLGVLAHEWGHVQARHSMRQLFQAGALGLLASAALGDFSGLVTTLPVALGQLAYSRDFEREADDSAIAVLQSNGISPAVMTVLFERLAHRPSSGASAGHPDEHTTGLGIAFSSHPAPRERIERFQQAGRSTPQ